MIDFKKHLLSTTMVVSLAALAPAALPGAALAQSTDPTTTSQDDKDKAADQVEEVVVVGSRIRTDNYTPRRRCR
jgi:iron complex outermembrane receptor protein